ncbi:hypothetical protein QLX67_12290, partial [Balneolaceae bacterium ANBcel3]|nr:hypothetical protein [Balneolaceae bacterium ANBcel3]
MSRWILSIAVCMIGLGTLAAQNLDSESLIAREEGEPAAGTVLFYTEHEGVHVHVHGENFYEEFLLRSDSVQISLLPGSYEWHAVLNGYQSLKRLIEIKEGER